MVSEQQKYDKCSDHMKVQLTADSVAPGADYDCGDADGDGVFGDVGDDDGICADSCMVAYPDSAEDFCAGADFDVAADQG